MDPVPSDGTLYSAVDLCRATGLSYRQSDYWVRCGVLIPVGNPMPGSGAEPRRYTAREVWLTAVLIELRKLGAGLDVLGRVAAQLRLDDAALHGRVFVDADGWVGHAPCAACWCVDLDAIAALVPTTA